MKHRLVLALPVGVLLLAAAALGGQAQVARNPYQPLHVGTKWVYRVRSGDQAGDHRVTHRVVKHEAVELATKDEKQKEDKRKVPVARVEVAGPDRTLSELVAILNDGVYRFQAAGKDLNPPLCILKLPPRAGEKWTYEAMVEGTAIKGEFVAGTAVVAVPAGKFQTVTASCKELQIGTEKVQLEYWFAPDVGLVKQRVHVGNYDVLLELEKFEPGKGE